MSADKPPVRLDADDNASRVLTKQAGVSWPFPVDARLDQLVEIANDAGAGTRRGELVAALIAATDPDPAGLLSAVIAWRRMKVREVVLGAEDAGATIDFTRHASGRRPRGA